MAQFVSRHLGVFYGPDDYRFRDRLLQIGIRAANRPPGYRRYRIWFGVSWDWLLKFGWIDEQYTDAAFGYPSHRWTGRRYRLLNWSWWFGVDGGIERA